MRPRTFILLIIVLIVFAAAVILGIFVLSDGGDSFAGLLGGNGDSDQADAGEEPGLPTPTATPAFESVVVAKVRLPVGEILTEEILDIEQRPITNIALQGGYTFTDTENLVGRILRSEVSRGQEILSPMIALNPTDVSSFGSDLALYVPFGEIAVALPVNRFSGASLAMRPGDKVDLIMTVRTVEIDPDFRSALPNNVERVIESALVAGQEFLFPAVSEGRLEFIPEINQVAQIVPGLVFLESQDWTVGDPIPKRSTQLTVQQSTVLYVGEWLDPRRLEREQEAEQAEAEATRIAIEEGGEPVPVLTPTPLPSRLDSNPDMIIISMSAQDALSLKYARESGVQIDVVVRSPGDQTQFVTTSVNLPQIIDQGGLAIPEPSDKDIFNPFTDPSLLIEEEEAP